MAAGVLLLALGIPVLIASLNVVEVGAGAGPPLCMTARALLGAGPPPATALPVFWCFPHRTAAQAAVQLLAFALLALAHWPAPQ